MTRPRGSTETTTLVLPAEHMGSPMMREVLGLLVFSPLDFKDFFDECAPRLHRWFTRRCGSDHTVAEDLVQEVFLQAFLSWDKLQYYNNPHAWVFMVARQMLQRYRRSAAKLTAERTEPHDPQVSDVESRIDLDRALGELTTVQRKVIILVHALEYTPSEAARLLDLKESTTRSHLCRARKKLKPYLVDNPENEEESR